MKKEKETKYLASCSFGKDSIATILLALENNEPLDGAVYSEVMFDIENNISGEIPEHADFIYNKAIPKLESMGVSVVVCRAKRDYLWYFKNPIPTGKYAGKYRGFPIGGHCTIQRDGKLNPIRDYYRTLKDDYNIIQYVGIAKDETKRLERLTPDKISLLDKYGYTEQMALELCRKYDLLSPIYEGLSPRNGCWFCPSQRMGTLAQLKINHPELWDKLKELSKTENLCSYGFKYGETIEEVERKIDKRIMAMNNEKTTNNN